MFKCKISQFLRLKDSLNKIQWWCLAMLQTHDSKTQPCSRKLSNSSNNLTQQNLSISIKEKAVTTLEQIVSHLNRWPLVGMINMKILQVCSLGLKIQQWQSLKNNLRLTRTYSWTWLTAPSSTFLWFRIRLVWMSEGHALFLLKKLSYNAKTKMRWQRWNKTYSIPSTSQLRLCIHGRLIS